MLVANPALQGKMSRVCSMTSSPPPPTRSKYYSHAMLVINTVSAADVVQYSHLQR